MAFQRVIHTAEVRCIVDYLSSEFVTTFYARDNTGYDSGNLDDLLQGIGDQFRDGFMLHLTSACTFDRAELRDLDTEFGYTAVREYNTAGTQTGDTAPPQLAVLTKIVGDPGGAPRQGHHFISGVKQAVYDASTNLWDSSIVDSIVVEENNMTDAISGVGITNTWARVIVSRVLHKEIRDVAVTNTIQSVQGRLLPGSQRDRRPTIGS